MTKIYTRTGDDGTTGLGDGSRTNKDSLRIEAIGAVDELNNAVGVALTQSLPPEVRDVLRAVQHRLFDLGGELSVPGYHLISPRHVEALEAELDELNQALKPLKEFIVPGGSKGAAWCHQARGVCRRAERRVVALAREETISEHGQHYLNRLSDYLFVAARYINQAAGVEDVLWQRDQS